MKRSLLVVFVLFVGCQLVDSESKTKLPEFVVITRNPEDELTPTLHNDTVIFDVSSPRGIGGATIKLNNSKWPKNMLLRLHLGGLEKFSLFDGSTTIRASVSSYGQHRKRLYVAEPGQKEEPLTKDNPYWVDIRLVDPNGGAVEKIPLKSGYIELAIPKIVLRNLPNSLSIFWVDFYRD